MRHRYVPKPTWKVWYAISYFDCTWNDIPQLAARSLDAFAVTGKVYEFTQMWARLERGQPIELPTDQIPIAFTVEVYHVEEEDQREDERQRIRSGYSERRHSSTVGRSGSSDEPAITTPVHDASVGQPDPLAPSRQADNPGGRRPLEGAVGHADGDYHRSDCISLVNELFARLEPSDSREEDSMVADVVAE